VFDIEWVQGVTYRDVRFLEEQQFSVYNFEKADVKMLWELFRLHEAEAQRLVDEYRALDAEKDYREKSRFPLLAAYDHVLNCSHTFNLLDARGAISVTERVAVIGRVRKLAVGVAACWIDQQNLLERQPAAEVQA
jgi:glycyl-tRNA synthetase alpha chain